MEDPKSRFIGGLMGPRTTISGTVVLWTAKQCWIEEHGTSQLTSNDKSANLPTLNYLVCVCPLESVSIEEFSEQTAFRQ